MTRIATLALLALALSGCAAKTAYRDSCANQLDAAVHHAVDLMLNEESFALESVEAYRERLKADPLGARITNSRSANASSCARTGRS